MDGGNKPHGDQQRGADPALPVGAASFRGGPGWPGANHETSSFTVRSSGSWWSARSGTPDSRKAALSSTELAGRGAGRGGFSSAVLIGCTRPGSIPAAPRMARANSNQVVAP